MSTTETVNEREFLDSDTEVLAPEQMSPFAEQLAAAFAMTGEDFVSLKVAERDLALFLLLRELCATVNGIEARLNLLEDKARVLASPEGLQGVVNAFLGGAMGGNGSGNVGKMLLGMMGK